jgi:hypothetical protein
LIEGNATGSVKKPSFKRNRIRLMPARAAMNLAMPISEWMDKRTGSAARQSRWMSLTAQLGKRC